MRKTYFLAALGAALLLAGAGCPQSNQSASEETGSTSTAGIENQTTVTKADLNLTAEALGSGVVKFTWTAPADFAAGSFFRLLHSAQTNPTFPGAFWYQRAHDEREGVWGALPVGPRHFRVCEFKDGACARYSNDVELEVK